jgi:hypothetical protein
MRFLFFLFLFLLVLAWGLVASHEFRRHASRANALELDYWRLPGLYGCCGVHRRFYPPSPVRRRGWPMTDLVQMMIATCYWCVLAGVSYSVLSAIRGGRRF